jgi:dienelactone hydrolase
MPTLPLANQLVVAGLAVALGACLGQDRPGGEQDGRPPPARGTFAVGTTAYDWVDRDRPEESTGDPDDRRELVVRAWYPATAVGPAAPYFLEPREAELNAALFGLPADAFSALPTRARQDAPVASSPDPFPVVVFSPGLRTPAALYSSFLEELASHGYAVFAVSHPYATGVVVFQDGRVAPLLEDRPEAGARDAAIATWSADQRFVLTRIEELNAASSHDRMRGHLDPTRIAVLGHSRGGAAAAQTCLDDPRLRACADLDGTLGAGAMSGTIVRPFLVMRSETAADHESTLLPFFERLAGIGYWVQVRGAGHNSFSDLPLLEGIRPPGGGDLMLGTIGAERAFEILTRHTLAFLDAHLQDAPAPLLAAPSPYPEVALRVSGR